MSDAESVGVGISSWQSERCHCVRNIVPMLLSKGVGIRVSNICERKYGQKRTELSQQVPIAGTNDSILPAFAEGSESIGSLPRLALAGERFASDRLQWGRLS